VKRVALFSKEPAQDLERGVSEFLADRVRRWLTDVAGVGGDTAEAVMAVGWFDLPDTMARANALQRVRESASFRSLALAFKRVRNISEGQPDSEVDEKLFSQPEEHELHRATVEFAGALEELLPARRVGDAFAAMEPLADILERYFVEVLVMCDDQRIRLNRIALLKNLGRQFMNLADLSKLQIEGGEQ
jgi:glycyl-tRNA synthetase beta chain